MSKGKTITSFAGRIAKYGLTPKDVHGDMLLVGKKQVLYLGSLGKKPSFYPPRFLRATGVEDIKRWIGTPDWVFKKKPEIAERHKLQKALSENLIASFDELFRKHSKETDPAQKKKYSDDIGGLFHKNRKEVRAVAKSYIYGNSASYANWRPLLDWHLRDFNFPIWLFGTVVVENGAVLELDEGYNILAGDTLVIEQGGTIRSGWAFNIDFRNLGRTL
jgi:hypothetical protein